MFSRTITHRKTHGKTLLFRAVQVVIAQFAVLLAAPCWWWKSCILRPFVRAGARRIVQSPAGQREKARKKNTSVPKVYSSQGVR